MYIWAVPTAHIDHQKSLARTMKLNFFTIMLSTLKSILAYTMDLLSSFSLCLQTLNTGFVMQQYQCCGHSERSCQLSIGVGSEVVRLCLPPNLCLGWVLAEPDSGVLGSSSSSPVACTVAPIVPFASVLGSLLMPNGSKAGNMSCICTSAIWMQT